MQMNNSNISNTFCVMPWIHVAIRPNGVMTFCGTTCLGPTKGTLLKEDNSTYNALKDPIDSQFNAPLAKEVRKMLLNGEKHPECHTCWLEESHNMISRRLRMNKLWKDLFNEDIARKVTNTETGELTEDYEMIDYDLRFGNFCNLKCRTCSPQNSSGWYDEWVELHNSPRFDDVTGLVDLVKNRQGKYVASDPGYEWFKDENFWNQFKSKLPHIRSLYLAGGEPLIIPKHDEMLKICIHEDYSKDIVLSYNTNLHRMTDELINLWGNFHSVNLLVSLDGTHEVSNYIRHPSKWETIETNLDRLDKHATNINIRIIFTVNMLNVYYLPDLMKWLIKKNYKYLSLFHSPSLRILYKPSYLNIQNLPEKIKEVISKEYDDFNSELPKIIENEFSFLHVKAKEKVYSFLSSKLTEVTHFMNAKNLKQKHFDKFVTVTNKLDEMRGESFKKSLNDFYEVMPKDIQELF